MKFNVGTDWWDIPFAMWTTGGMGWFRVFGYGLHWKDTRRHPMLFSERVLGYGWRRGPWIIKILYGSRI